MKYRRLWPPDVVQDRRGVRRRRLVPQHPRKVPVQVPDEDRREGERGRPAIVLRTKHHSMLPTKTPNAIDTP